VTTHGALKLADFEGSWLILFSHPADFTPVCTTEFIAFAEIYPELQKRGTELLGLSIDGLSAHIAWVRNIEEKAGVKIQFPIIADLDRKVRLPTAWSSPARARPRPAAVSSSSIRRDPARDDLLPALDRSQTWTRSFA